MNKKKYRSSDALREHILEGNNISELEAIVLFGLQSFHAKLTDLKREGFLMKSQRVPMLKIIRRVNKFAHYEPPKNLPVKEIEMTEYWLSK